MNLRERMRRWWKPAEYAEDHPLSEEEREEFEELELPSLLGKPGEYNLGGGINVDDEFRRG